MVKKPLDKSLEDMPVTMGMCHQNREDCGITWGRYLKLVGVICGIAVTIVMTLFGVFYSADEKNREAIAATNIKVETQQTDLKYIRTGLDEIRTHYIKEEEKK